MYRRICIEQFSRHLGLHDDLAAEEKISLAKEYIQLHRDGLKYGMCIILNLNSGWLFGGQLC